MSVQAMLQTELSTDDLTTVLLDWYDRHARELPWRVGPRGGSRGLRPDPYRVWLSEVMLQQTTVAAVKDYFLKFTSIWPTVHDLAAASEDDVLKAWAGLGYYSRARNLKKCADMVVSKYGGEFPVTAEELRKLPGIGDYTSAAIASIAFGEPAPVVDGNVERVITRLFAIETPLPEAKKEIKAKVAEFVPTTRPGDFAQATMDLGATICTPKRPACMPCPCRSMCKSVANEPERFPVKPPKKTKPLRRGAAFVAMSSDDQILLEKRPPTGLLGGMTQVPTTGWNSRKDGDTSVDAAPFPADWKCVGAIRHVFTHFELELVVYRADVGDVEQKEGWWVPLNKARGEALPTVMKKAVAAALPNLF
ncbi:MAG: A/G-specific adenine glycosylase [Pseudomonadota bacterium]